MLFGSKQIALATALAFGLLVVEQQAPNHRGPKEGSYGVRDESSARRNQFRAHQNYLLQERGLRRANSRRFPLHLRSKGRLPKYRRLHGQQHPLRILLQRQRNRHSDNHFWGGILTPQSSTLIPRLRSLPRERSAFIFLAAETRPRDGSSPPTRNLTPLSCVYFL
jgi:hypothetical protein